MRAARAEPLCALALAALFSGACGTDVIHLQGHVDSPAPKSECVSRMMLKGGVVCVYCGADYTVQRACLKCTPPTATATCGACAWSDGIEGGAVCKQCSDESGVVSTIGCYERPDLYPPGT